MGAAPLVPTAAAPTWVQSSTAATRPLAVPATAGPPAGSNAAPEASLQLDGQLAIPPAAPIQLPPLPPLPTVRSPDGQFVLTDTHLTVRGQSYRLRGLERAHVQHVRWVLWVLLGALGLAAVLIAFLQNWLHTLPTAAGLVATALLLAYGQRGTNRLQLWQLSPQPMNFALPGELASWQRLVAELNRRIARTHDRAAAEAAALLVTTTELPPENSAPGPDATYAQQV